MKLKDLILPAFVLPVLLSCGGGLASVAPDAGPADAASAVYDNIMTRRSVRKYKPQPVERAKMDTIIECGINAPNGQNRQSYQVRVVDNPDFINGLTDVYLDCNPGMKSDTTFKNMFRNAPTVVFIAGDSTYDMAPIDCGLLGGNMVLSAWSMGIGSCCLGSPVRFMQENPEARRYLEQLDFGEGYTLLYAIGFGYPDETPAAKPRRTDMVRYVD